MFGSLHVLIVKCCFFGWCGLDFPLYSGGRTLYKTKEGKVFWPVVAHVVGAHGAGVVCSPQHTLDTDANIKVICFTGLTLLCLLFPFIFSLYSLSLFSVSIPPLCSLSLYSLYFLALCSLSLFPLPPTSCCSHFRPPPP